MNDYLDNTLQGRFTQTLYRSHNKHYEGFSLKYGMRLFIKIYFDFENFNQEFIYYQTLEPSKIIHVDASKLMIAYPFIDYQPLSVVDGYGLGRLCAQLHLRLQTIKEAKREMMPSLRAMNLMRRLEDNSRITEIKTFYDKIQPMLLQADLEYEKMPKAMVHGDFGLRNIMVSEATVVVLDFEMIRYDIPYMDVLSLFQQDLTNLQSQQAFIEGYTSINDLLKPQKTLQHVLTFIKALEAIAYGYRFNDLRLESTGWELLNQKVTDM